MKRQPDYKPIQKDSTTGSPSQSKQEEEVSGETSQTKRQKFIASTGKEGGEGEKETNRERIVGVSTIVIDSDEQEVTSKGKAVQHQIHMQWGSFSSNPQNKPRKENSKASEKGEDIEPILFQLPVIEDLDKNHRQTSNEFHHDIFQDLPEDKNWTLE